jgi:small-conductance mechanosensitive channel
MDAALLELHRERMALEASIRDLDGAVRRLDEILVMVVFVIDVLIIISMATGDTKFSGWISSSATFVLSLSWMIGTTTQEILAACIFVFVKHPYDVGDRVDIDSNSYTVAKVELLSTSFKRTDGKFVWIAHNILTTKVIENVRRSGATSEKFVFDVAFDTTFEQLQALRDRMLKFCKENSRDFLPAFDVTVADMPEQGKMTLNADIKYRSNWQLGALKIRRRNMWIWGPAGAGNPDPAPADPTRYTVVPWDEVRATSAPHDHRASPPPPFEAAMAANALHSRHDSTTDLFDDIVGSGANTTGFNTPVMLGRSLPPLEGLAYPSQIAPQRPGVQQQGYPQQGFNPQIYNQGYGGRL